MFLRIAGLASWNDIGKRMITAFDQWRDVILRKMSFGASATISTTMIKYFLNKEPLRVREVVDGTVGLTGAAALICSFVAIWIFNMIGTSRNTSFLMMSRLIRSAFGIQFFTMYRIICSFFRKLFFPIGSIVDASFGTSLFYIFCIILFFTGSKLFTMDSIVSTVFSILFLWIGGIFSFSMFGTTCTTPGTFSIMTPMIIRETIKRKYLFALSTDLHDGALHLECRERAGLSLDGRHFRRAANPYPASSIISKSRMICDKKG